MQTIILALGLLCFAVYSNSKNMDKDKAWKLVWSDEFNYSGLPDSTNSQMNLA